MSVPAIVLTGLLLSSMLGTRRARARDVGPYPRVPPGMPPQLPPWGPGPVPPIAPPWQGPPAAPSMFAPPPMGPPLATMIPPTAFPPLPDDMFADERAAIVTASQNLPAAAPMPMPAPAVVAPKAAAPKPKAAPKPMPTDARNRSGLLKIFLDKNPTPEAFGYKGHPSSAVRAFQSAAGITDDGIVGPQTRDAAKKFGVTLPPRPSAPGTITPKQHAEMLKVYLTNNRTNPDAFGIGSTRNPQVAAFQRRVGTTQDGTGILGWRTRAAAKKLGVNLPPNPPKPKAAAKPKAPAPMPTDARNRAGLLQIFLERNPTPAAFGFKGHPSSAVKAFQSAAGLTPDGIVGPKTREAAARYGAKLPPRPTEGRVI